MKKQAILLGLLLMMPVFTAAAESDRGPVEIVQETTSKTLDTIHSRRAEFEAEPALLREFVRNEVLALIDVEYSARLVLGRAGRGASDQQLEEFATALSEVLINRYADGLLGFHSEGQVEVLPLKGDHTDKLTRVRMKIKLQNGGFAPIGFAFRKTDQGWKAFDITVEGISYVITYRNQLSPLVQKEGIEKVTADIRQGNIEVSE